MENTPDILEEMDSTANALEIAQEYGLTIEVICFSLKAMKQNPSLTVEAALICGLEEWDLI